MTSATAAIPGSPSFQSSTRARAVVSAGPARAPDMHAAASRTAAAILVRLLRLNMSADYAAIDAEGEEGLRCCPGCPDGGRE